MYLVIKTQVKIEINKMQCKLLINSGIEKSYFETKNVAVKEKASRMESEPSLRHSPGFRADQSGGTALAITDVLSNKYFCLKGLPFDFMGRFGNAFRGFFFSDSYVPASYRHVEGEGEGWGQGKGSVHSAQLGQRGARRPGSGRTRCGPDATAPFSGDRAPGVTPPHPQPPTCGPGGHHSGHLWVWEWGGCCCRVRFTAMGVAEYMGEGKI